MFFTMDIRECERWWDILFRALMQAVSVVFGSLFPDVTLPTSLMLLKAKTLFGMCMVVLAVLSRLCILSVVTFVFSEFQTDFWKKVTLCLLKPVAQERLMASGFVRLNCCMS
jgi:hypothetical protein